MKKRFLIIAIAMLVILALAALSAPASAWPGALPLDRTIAGDPGNSSNIKENVTVANGTFTIEWYKDDGSPNGYFDFAVPDKNLNWIGIYHSVWTSKDCIDQSFTYNSHSLGTLQFGDPDSSTCDQNDNTRSTGLGTNGVWFDDETANTTKGATNTFRSWGGSSTFHGTAMPMVFNDSSDQGTLHYWFSQGYDDADNHTKVGNNYTMNYSICNVTKDLSTEWTLLVAVTCADSGIIKINGHTLPNGYAESTKYYHVAINDVHSYLNTTTNGTNYVELSTTDQYFHPFWIWLVDAKQWTDISVTDIYGTPRPNSNSTVNATIENTGGVDVGHFNVSLYVDDVLNGTVNVTAGLAKGASTTVSFTKVNESKGCQSFRVFADSDNDITEPNEVNNNMTKSIQVGYVIVVESDGDFDDLVNESKNGTLGAGNVTKTGTTYYIQNFTGNSAIENCAGNGITIKDTNTKFVIRNSTIENCTGRGVTFHNLKNGTIENSTVQNCTEYGIELGLLPLDSDDPEFVNITNNTINGTKIGVYLVGFNCTVKNNTISNSTEYGIYLLANDTNITNNTAIRDNTDYGVKLYNSARCYVYCNTFTGNNATHSGHQAWDNGNTNYWNSTDADDDYVGNRWKDWDDNSGYPSNYTIDGGSNADKRPKGLYDFLTDAGTDKWAFEKEVSAKPPNGNGVPNTEFSPTDYNKIKTDNEDYKKSDSATNGYYAAHRFNFSISESSSSITKINVTWNGKGWHDNGTSYNGTQLYIWNGTGYDELASTTSGADATLTGENATAATNYINGGNVTVLVVQKSADHTDLENERSHIWTDYVRVAVVDP